MQKENLIKQKIAVASGESPSSDSVPSHQEIEIRAYAIFLERGSEHGHDVEDWLQAEHELKNVLEKPVAKAQSA